MIFTILALPLILSNDLPKSTPAHLRARAALALAFSDVKPLTYDEQRERAAKEGKPLVVWVGQPVRAVVGCLTVGCATFPGVEKDGVVVGVPAGKGLNRIDLPGRPTDVAVLEAVRKAVGP